MLRHFVPRRLRLPVCRHELLREVTLRLQRKTDPVKNEPWHNRAKECQWRIFAPNLRFDWYDLVSRQICQKCDSAELYLARTAQHDALERTSSGIYDEHFWGEKKRLLLVFLASELLNTPVRHGPPSSLLITASRPLSRCDLTSSLVL